MNDVKFCRIKTQGTEATREMFVLFYKKLSILASVVMHFKY